jgi:hypothetical protein
MVAVPFQSDEIQRDLGCLGQCHAYQKKEHPN